MTYIGIDPGKMGALAIIDDSAGETNVTLVPFDVMDYRHHLALIDEHKAVAAVERVGAMPGQGVTSMFNFGENYGTIQGLLLANYIPYELVTPQRWRKAFGITGDKNASIDVARRLFPGVDLKRSKIAHKDNDGMAEALLLAEYARRTMGGHNATD